MRMHEVDILLCIGAHMAGVSAAAGFPALGVPGGYRANGEPVNVTLIGDYLDDGKLIAAAYAFEQTATLRRNPDLG